MGTKFALIIANTEYIDPGLAQLTAPSKDADTHRSNWLGNCKLCNRFAVTEKNPNAYILFDFSL